MQADTMGRVLVTGATGFVGRRLCRTLVMRGHGVLAAVRRPPQAAALPDEIRCLPAGEIDPHTAWDPAWFEGIDTVLHLAARVHVLHDPAADPAVEFDRVNVQGTERLARAAAGRVRRFVYVSSVHAMCTLAEERLDESHPCRPDTPYGASKLEAERRLHEIGARTGLEVVVLRPPPVYGPGHLGNLMRLLQMALRGWPLPLGSISNQRSLIFVDNLADALAACVTHRAAAGGTFLVCDGEDVSVPELVRRVGAAAGRRVRLLPTPVRLLRLAARLSGRSAAVERLLGSLAVDGSRIRDTLSWTPPHPMDEGLAATAAWMRRAA